MRGSPSYEMTSTCGLRPAGGGYQPPMMMEPPSPSSAWQFHSVIPKPESEERNDSGIASGSDFVSSSPGSDHSENSNIQFSSLLTSQGVAAPIPPPFYSTPVIRSNMAYHASTIPVYNEHKPLISSTVDSAATPVKGDSTMISPRGSPGSGRIQHQEESNDSEDPLRRLEMSLEKNGFLPSALSPKLSECSAEDENKSDNDPEEFDEQGLRIPKVNSHGKVKTFKCKQCDFVAITKLNFWEHSKSHIKADKLLTCTKCPFVTEYKHHLEYHLRNHTGSKPFSCTQCSYSCVNKSMLNSHLKSHSNIYQYRCSDCSYATKYCHSLKLHLRKYGHKPAMVLNPDGTPNPLPIIDVYGTRRGPKLKSQEQRPVEEQRSPQPEQVIPFPLNQFMLNAQSQLPFAAFPFFAGFPGPLANTLLMQNLEKIARERQSSVLNREEPQPVEKQPQDEVLDLSKPEEPSQNRRVPQQDDSSGDEEEDDTHTTMFSNVEVVENKEAKAKEEEMTNNNKEDFNCQFCKISFGDLVLYTMHMGYHGYKDPFTCNMCGQECNDKVSFFLHIARTPHN
ncbi:unnamed protein product [Acanthoscelides obtectus]|nr:unnamed protein product [Acanthoscelides obtectus]CAK1630506.1 Protein hunchback [Acanthoscelides obtectus]